MNKKTDLALLIIFPILAAWVSLFFQASFWFSTILFFGAPSLFLAVRHKQAVKKTILFSLLFSVPLTFIFDYLIAKDRGWHIVSTVFPIRLFGLVVGEQFIWTFLWVFYIVIFYEYYLDKQPRRSLFLLFGLTNPGMVKRMEYFALALFMGLFLFINFAYLSPALLTLNYSYLILGAIFGIIPLSLFLFRFPNLVGRFFLMTAYFLPLAVVIEYVGLKLNHWTFPGSHFLGTINYFGFLIPYEEIILYFFLSTPIILSYYEFFDDDQK